MNVVVVSNECAPNLKLILKKKCFYDNNWLAKLLVDNKIALPVNDPFIRFFDEKLRFNVVTEIDGIQFELAKTALQPNRKKESCSPVKILKNALLQSRLWDESLLVDLPRSYEKFEDVLLLNENSFNLEFWQAHDLWEVVASAYNCKRIARKRAITCDNFRSPRVSMLYGNSGWVEHRDNGIRYKYDITKCMFSPGNITEKIRISKFDCSTETVIDLYAGIGYFTLPYLVHAKARKVYACEWNPSSIEALKINLELNGVSERCVVLHGDNKQVCPRDIADRVNLGLIPSSEDGWTTACRALKKDKGGILHVHGNVTSCKSSLSEDLYESDGSSNSEVAFPSNDGPIPCGESNLVDVRHELHQSNPQEQQPVMKNTRYYDKTVKRKEWNDWSVFVSGRLKTILKEIHGKEWSAEVFHVEHVKSYAPHIDHIVVDVRCIP